MKYALVITNKDGSTRTVWHNSEKKADSEFEKATAAPENVSVLQYQCKLIDAWEE